MCKRNVNENLKGEIEEIRRAKNGITGKKNIKRQKHEFDIFGNN